LVIIFSNKGGDTTGILGVSHLGLARVGAFFRLKDFNEGIPVTVGLFCARKRSLSLLFLTGTQKSTYCAIPVIYNRKKAAYTWGLLGEKHRNLLHFF
jgi:hypothetical protein